LEVFDDLKLVHCPRSLAPTPFSGDDVGMGRFALSSSDSSFNQKMSRLAVAAAIFTAGGTETLSVSREAGNSGEWQCRGRFALRSSDSSFNQKMSTLNWKARPLLAHPLRVARSNVKI
jgi:hypothetical protein